MFALHRPPLFYDPAPKLLNFFQFYDNTCCFQSPKLDDCCQFFFFDVYNRANYTQFLHVVYDSTVDRAPGRFSSHCRNRWSILCLKSKNKNKNKTKLPPACPHFQTCVEGKQTICWPNIGFPLNLEFRENL